MQRSKLSIALTCNSFEDFPVRLPTDQARSLLKCWTALWHPQLVSESNSRPDIWCIAPNSENVTDRKNGSNVALVVPLSVLPDFERSELDISSFATACLDDQKLTRGELVLKLQHELATESQSFASKSDSHSMSRLAEDFFALGYAWLQIRLMTLRVRYSTNLDDAKFDECLIEAAVAWRCGDRDLASRRVTRCFDLLLEEKNAYYSVEPSLLDLVLVESETIDQKLESQLKLEHHLNLLLTGKTIELADRKHSELLEKIRTRLDSGSLSITGGLQRELPAGSIPLESQLRQFTVGSKTFSSHLNCRPKTLARRKFGFTSMTPGLLEQLDFHGDCHMSLDGGILPDVHGSTMRWVGEDAQTIPALSTVPVDANDSRSFLDLGVKIARQIDSEHSATIVFAHWPVRFCDSFQDLVCASSYGSLLGDFVGFEDYFNAAFDPGYGEQFIAEQYERPGLVRQAIENVVDPISRFVRYWELHFRVMECRSLVTIFSFLADPQTDPITSFLSRWIDAIGRVEQSIDLLVDQGEHDSNLDDLVAETRQSIESVRQEVIEKLFDLSGQTTAQWFLNPTTSPRKSPSPNGELVDVPGSGWSTLNSTSGSKPSRLLAGPPVDDELTLRNEYFQIHVDARSGGIRSIQTYEQRQTVASQRLSVRFSDGRKTLRYADMVADKVVSDRISPNESQIVSTGHLADPSTRSSICEFTQTVSLRREDRFADIYIELHQLEDLPQSADCYVCSRIAWSDESSPVHFGASEIRSRSSNLWIEAPTYIRVEQPEHALTLLTRGLPWHRRSARNRLDSILVIGNERERRFRMSVGLDCADDLNAAIGRSIPVRSICATPKLFNDEGWLFHFNRKNIAGLFCEPLLNEMRMVGVRWRLLETQGLRGKLRLTCPFQLARADRMMFDGRNAGSLQFDGQVVEIDFTRNEYFEIHLYFS